MKPVFTIGHSLHEISAFINLLHSHGIEAVADVRSHPYSKRLPQFSKTELQLALKRAGIQYVFLGQELGARRNERDCYVNGQAKYERIAQLPAFAEGIARIQAGAKRMNLSLMCAEKDPITCHRTILVCRELVRMGLDVKHILDDGSLELHEDAQKRMMIEEGFIPGQLDIFGEGDDSCSVTLAYEKRGLKIAYRESDGEDEIIYDRIHTEVG
jgi:uncharacterized protein (DUF488 family)